MSSSDSPMMAADTRSKNVYFDSTSLETYVKSYATALEKALSALDFGELEKLRQVLDSVRVRKQTVWVAGNGGSHAIAEHLCCDWTKGLEHNALPSLKVQSLGSNGALMTALANDLSYADVFSEQVRMFAQKGDLLILISSSGNSPNVLKAAELAKKADLTVASLVGFSGGKLREISDINLYVNFANYGIVEDAHQILMHVLAQFSYLKANGR